MQIWWRTALKEPLVHFMLAGLALFLFFAWRGTEVDPQSRSISIESAQVEQLSATWMQAWRRPPTREELDGLIRDQVKEEIYYREGLRLGLDQDDPIIRRRIRSKMEFLAQSQAENAVPAEADLQAMIDRNPGAYASDARYTFDQIYLADPDPAKSETRAKEILQRLRAGTKWTTAGDSIALPPIMTAQERHRIEAEFGDQFAAALPSLSLNEWHGPVPSGFGSHLVRVRKVEGSTAPKLDDIRQRVENDWRAQTAKSREAKAYQALLDSYTIKIAKP